VFYLIIIFLGFLISLANYSMFFFNEELIIALALAIFIIGLICILRQLFLKTFFIEINFFFVCFNYLFKFDLNVIFIVSLFVTFLKSKNRLFIANFLNKLAYSYNLCLFGESIFS